MENILEIRNVSKTIGSFKLNDIILNLRKGTVMGLIGENGAGKTSLLKLILNSFCKDGGSITILGKDNIKDEEFCKNIIGYIPAESYLLDKKSVGEHAKIFKSFYDEWDEEILYSYLKKYSIPSNIDCSEFSTGMKVKAMIALALAHKPKLLIIDEATANLDTVVRKEILDMIREFVDDGERSALISTHITSDLDKIADYVTILNKGEIKESLSIDEMQEKYAVVRGEGSQFNMIEDCLVGYEKDEDFFRALVLREKADKNLRMSIPKIEDLSKYFILGGR